ncbi:hypothetical protein [Rubrivirga sp.]|uniref:hypothetical protein n=1 Tax=Rubrivirga sp. TaxID=1885344 RepID=UPI003B5181EE
MSTSRLADRQIREAASQAALRLDVRGPVSQALARTGVTVPPADVAETEPAAPAPTRELRRRARGLAAPRVVKPFEPAAWPTRSAADPLSGLTADERRVHRILIDTLDVQAEDPFGGTTADLTYAERQKLQALDLAFIDAQLAATAGPSGAAVRRWTVWSTAALGGLLLAVALSGGIASAGFVIGSAVLLLVVSAAVAAGLIPVRGGAVPAQHGRIYQALRELALLAHADDLASDALTQADLLIDRLADADQASSDTSTARARVRS